MAWLREPPCSCSDFSKPWMYNSAKGCGVGLGGSGSDQHRGRAVTQHHPNASGGRQRPRAVKQRGFVRPFSRPTKSADGGRTAVPYLYLPTYLGGAGLEHHLRERDAGADQLPARRRLLLVRRGQRPLVVRPAEGAVEEAAPAGEAPFACVVF